MTVELKDNDNAILEYQQSSARFRVAYRRYREYRETIILETNIMFNALITAGYTNKAAINKISEDHKDLKGFSQRTIYRNLPAEVKDHLQRDRRLGYHNPVVKNNEFGNQNESVIGPEEVQGHQNISPVEYKIEELENYDKNRLIEIVRTLHLDIDNLRYIVNNGE